MVWKGWGAVETSGAAGEKYIKLRKWPLLLIAAGLETLQNEVGLLTTATIGKQAQLGVSFKSSAISKSQIFLIYYLSSYIYLHHKYKQCSLN